jgi:hypothetical protein
MQTVTNNYKTAIDAPIRRLRAKVDLFEGSSLVQTFTQNDDLKSLTIERTGEDSKFFGFGVSHKVNIKLRDINRVINISTANAFKIYIGVEINGSVEYVSFPKMRVTEVNRAENTNELSITAYDVLNDAKTAILSDLTLQAPYTIQDVANAVGDALGLTTITPELTVFNLEYPEGANFEGTETLQEVLKAIAEATQTVYFIDANDKLVFKRLDKDGPIAKEINKNTYITLDSKTNKRLQTIASVTELGDNVSASILAIGSTQYVRDNAFYELREDIDVILNAAIEEMGGISINQYECAFRGDMALEIGDKIGLTTKDNEQVVSYLLNDTITYDGSLSQKSFWNYEESTETASNPSNLGELLKQTYARVDKANKTVEIVASETTANSEAISTLQLSTETINVAVQNVEKNTNEVLENMNNNVNDLTKRVEATMTAEDVSILVKSELDNGVSKVETTTGFKFDETGLNISKTGSEMTTRIDEDGMTIQRDAEDVLIANHEGVNAYNLHAKTYLIIGESSRFEDYENEDGETRTGCFWIGGGN